MATNGNPNVGSTGAVSSNNSDAQQTKAGGKPKNPQEVGWQFVPQYYTFLFNEPQRLHCFYNKRSTFIHGVEGEESKPCFGQQEINDKIESLNFNDCKTFISSIDAQGSADGGIIIQSIGEMSNNSGPWRKFTQTFFLAEQPNGYFVLNDIFKYLKEEGDDEDEVEEDEPVEEAAGGAEEEVVEPEIAEASTEREQESAVVVDATMQADQAIPEPAEGVVFTEASGANAEATESSEEEATTAADIPEEKEPEQIQTSSEPPTAEEVEETPEPAAEPTPTSPPAPAPAAASAPPPAPKAAEKPAAPAPAQAPAAPAQPPKPSGPKTWASLAATGKGAWGSSLASKEATSSAPAPAATPAAAPTPAAPAQKAAPQAPAAPAQQQQQQQQQSQGNQKGGNAQGGRFSSRLEAAKNVQTPICFVKLNNWQAQNDADAVDENTLGAVLSRFGEIAKVEIVKNKACAFVEYKSVESARKAIIISLSIGEGGEGGVRTPDGSRILVESRKEKEERGKGPAPGGREQGNRRGPPSGTAGGPAQQNAGGRAPQQQQQQQQQAPAAASAAVDDQGFIPAGKPARTQQGGNRGGKGPRGGKTGGGGGDRAQGGQK